MDSCVILKIHYSKSALYISGRMPFSLFSLLWFSWMYQNQDMFQQLTSVEAAINWSGVDDNVAAKAWVS